MQDGMHDQSRNWTWGVEAGVKEAPDIGDVGKLGDVVAGQLIPPEGFERRLSSGGAGCQYKEEYGDCPAMALDKRGYERQYSRFYRYFF